MSIEATLHPSMAAFVFSNDFCVRDDGAGTGSGAGSGAAAGATICPASGTCAGEGDLDMALGVGDDVCR